MLAGVRMAIGAGAWATPRLAGRLFGLDVAGNPQAPYLARLFGARDLALAWGALGAEGSARRQWLLAARRWGCCRRSGAAPASSRRRRPRRKSAGRRGPAARSRIPARSRW